MKKKALILTLLATGAVLLCVSVVLAAVATASKDIIGGPGLPTFLTVLFHQNGGILAVLAFLGLICILASIVIGIIKKQ